MANQYSIALTKQQAKSLEELLSQATGFSPAQRDFAAFCFEKQGLNVAFFQRSGKLLVQGQNSDEFLEFFLEPKLLGVTGLLNAEKSATSTTTSTPKSLDLRPHFGIDESGKGDYFGPLVIAGVFCEGESAKALHRIGCCDSKAIKSEQKINQLADKIIQTPGIAYDIICMGPARYNELYAQMGNLNKLLAWGHARVIASLHEKVPTCPRALSDQFAKEWVLKSALKARHIPVELEQQTKAERDIAVAAASILARARFVKWMREASVATGQKIPLGCAPHVLKAAKDFVARHGQEKLNEVAKLHFKLTAQL